MALGATALLVVGLLPATSQADTTSVQPSFLSGFGPVSADTGYPTWFEDSTGMRLQHCLDGTPLCDAAALPVPDPAQPVSFPDNFPDESFYFSATADATLPTGGRALFIAAVEALFDGPGSQQVMARIRLRIDTPSAGHYVVTHPYGVDEFDVTAGDDRSINFTSDVGISTGVFDGVLDGRIDPFLTWDTGLVTGPNGDQYLGDPGVEHAVTGSPFDTNFFRIDGPDIGGPGINTFTSNLFALLGKIATNVGLDPGHPTYSRTDTDGGMVDVVASTDPNKAVKAILPGDVSTTSLRGGPDGHYVARLPFIGATPPDTATVMNVSDTPHAVFHLPVTDLVTVTDAYYDSDLKTLTVSGASSDQAVPPDLTATGFGPLDPGTQDLSPATPVTTEAGTSTGSASGEAEPAVTADPPTTLVGTVQVGTQVFTDVASPPEIVTVTSSAGGSGTAVVKVSGSAFPSDPVSADAGPDQTAQQGQPVTLDGSGSLNFSAMGWVQISGPAVTLTGADSAIATFTAPSTATTLGFRLIVQGPGGPATDGVLVTVQAVTAPVANAGPDQSVLVGNPVALDATGSTGAASFAWIQIFGPTVTLNGADTARPTFEMPAAGSTPLIFQVTVTGPGGSASDLVSITATPDVLTVDRAEFRLDKAEWRIEGTSSVLDGNTVIVYLDNGTSGPEIGRAQVLAIDGTWAVRVRNSNIQPGANSTVTVQSTRGGLLVGIPFELD